MICLLASSLGPSGGGVGKGIGSMKITFIPLTPSHMYLPCQWVTHFCPRTHSLLVQNQGQVHGVAYLSPNSLACKCTHLTWFLASTGADPIIFYGRGGGPNFGLEWTVCGKLLLPHIPFHQSQLHIIGRVVAIIVDQLRKQRQPLVSQSVNAGRHWRGKYCFARRGEQITGGYSKTITLLNIPGI